MTDTLVWDIEAGVVIAMAVLVVVLEMQDYRRQKNLSGRWTFLFKASASIFTALVMVGVILRVYPDQARLPPDIGRSALILLLAALALGSIFQHRRGKRDDSN